MQLAGRLYKSIPARHRPAVKKVITGSMLRFNSLIKNTGHHTGNRVEFVDFECASLEDYEFLGPGKNEALVDMLYTLVSPGTERSVLCGLPGARRPFPYAPGYSGSGHVIRGGKNLNGLGEGILVAGRMGHAGTAVGKKDHLFRVPAGVLPEEACFIELGIIVLQGIRKAGIFPGDHVAVIGQGLIGQLANKLAKIAGASYVTAIAASRRRQATACTPDGADHFVSLRENPQALDSIEADVVIEAVGHPRAVDDAVRCTRKAGRLVLLGSSRGIGRAIEWMEKAQEKNIAMIGAHIGAMPEKDDSSCRWTYRHEGELFLDLLAARKLKVADLITWKAMPSECNMVYEIIAEGGREHIGIIFDWSRK